MDRVGICAPVRLHDGSPDHDLVRMNRVTGRCRVNSNPFFSRKGHAWGGQPPGCERRWCLATGSLVPALRCLFPIRCRLALRPVEMFVAALRSEEGIYRYTNNLTYIAAFAGRMRLRWSSSSADYRRCLVSMVLLSTFPLPCRFRMSAFDDWSNQHPYPFMSPHCLTPCRWRSREGIGTALWKHIINWFLITNDDEY